jgi:hypothetical protein
MCLVTLQVEIGWALRMALASRNLNALDGFRTARFAIWTGLDEHR